MTQALKTREGRLLYAELPEEYRYRDNPENGELGDLEAYLHAFGHVLDLIRGTIEQSYADAFAADSQDVEESLAGERRIIQPWIVPYLADLVGARLFALDPEARAEELSSSVRWFKSKGTLRSLDEIGDVVSHAETSVTEGWRRTLVTPHVGRPPYADPDVANDPAQMRLGTPDMRLSDYAVADPDGVDPLFRLTFRERDAAGVLNPEPTEVFWKQRARGGKPCFPGDFDDLFPRTPDLRDPARYADVGPHPRRVHIHVRPPTGFFDPGQKELDPGATVFFDDELETIDPAELISRFEPMPDPAPDRVELHEDVIVRKDGLVELVNINIHGKLTVREGARVVMRGCAVDRIQLPAKEAEPSLVATDCLIGSIGPVGFAELVQVTVLGATVLERLWASDCIFAGDELFDLDCGAEGTCIRYSRVPANTKASGPCEVGKQPTNTTDRPHFLAVAFCDPGAAPGDPSVFVRRPAVFGEPGCGVLALTSPATILQGAENEGEMGAYNHRHYAARLRALTDKLKDFMPLGQSLALRYDARLLRPPGEKPFEGGAV